MDGIRPHAEQKVQRGGQPGDAVAVQGAGFQAGGIGVGLRLGKALHAGAAHFPGTDLHTVAHAQPAGALRTHQAFVAREADGAGAQRREIEGQDPGCLGGVYHQRQPVGAAEAGHPRQVHRVPDEVGGMGAHHAPRPGRQQPFKIPVIQPAPAVRRNKVHRAALGPQPIERTQDGIVLQIGGNHMIPRPEQPRDGDVQRLRGVGGEAHVIRTGTAQQRCQLFPGAVDQARGVQRAAVGTPAAVAQTAQRRRNRLRHLGRLAQGGGRVVQIDHGLTTREAPASFSTMEYILVTPPTASLSVRP